MLRVKDNGNFIAIDYTRAVVDAKPKIDCAFLLKKEVIKDIEFNRKDLMLVVNCLDSTGDSVCLYNLYADSEDELKEAYSTFSKSLF